ncbi:hypothetical protein QNK12_09920 [Neobacillus cucumis]|nr:hypothetical protein QNK12_09920 [Neobacillus cucumis]
MKKSVKVHFVFEGIIKESEVLRGVLFGGERVLVAGNEGVGLYNAIPTDQPGVYLVNLDEDDRDYLSQSPEFLLDLVLA